MDLCKLFENEEEDRVYLERILEYIDDTIAEDDSFMQILLIKLEGLILHWELPWYQQYRNLSNNRIKEVRDDMYRTDKFSQDEKDHIHKRWKKLVKKYDVPDKPICLVRWRSNFKRSLEKSFNPKCLRSAKLFVIAFLAKGLRRTMHQVNFYFESAHIQTERIQKYSENEDRVIEIFMKYQSDLPLSSLCRVLRRKKRHLYTRALFLKNGKPEAMQHIKWDRERASSFLNMLLKVTDLELDKLNGRFLGDNVWHVIHKKFQGGRRFWYDKLHVQLFVQREVKLNRFRRKIFKKLKTSPYKIWSDINWENLTKQLTTYDGITKRFTYKAAYGLFHREEKMLHAKPLPEVIEYALQKTKSAIYRGKNKRLKRMTLTEDGDLKWVDYSD